MDRRQFLATGLAGSAALAAPARALAAVPSTARHFEVTTEVLLSALGPEPAQLWLPLFQRDRNYQQLLSARWDGNGATTLQHDPASGAAILHARWEQNAPARQLVLTQRLATWEHTGLPGRLSAADRAHFTRATPLVPTHGTVAETARNIVGDRRDPRTQARALYDWMLANTWRDPATRGCGDGNVSALLRERKLGGKCVDLSRLFVAMNRALGIPAREVYGLRLAPSSLFKSLGRAGDVSGAQHCRAEVWLDDASGGTGRWLAADPADVRKAILEEKLPLEAPAIQALATRLFGQWESNWAGYNSAEALTLPGATRTPSYDFLMYPAAMTASTACNWETDAGSA